MGVDAVFATAIACTVSGLAASLSPNVSELPGLFAQTGGFMSTTVHITVTIEMDATVDELIDEHGFEVEDREDHDELHDTIMGRLQQESALLDLAANIGISIKCCDVQVGEKKTSRKSEKTD